MQTNTNEVEPNEADEVIGSIADDGTYRFPYIETTDKSNRKRIWTVIVRLVEKSIYSSASKHIEEWDPTMETSVPINLAMCIGEQAIPHGVVAQFWTESGIKGKTITQHMPKYPTIKNKGKKNELNVLQSAISEARSAFKKHFNKTIGVPQLADLMSAMTVDAEPSSSSSSSSASASSSASSSSSASASSSMSASASSSAPIAKLTNASSATLTAPIVAPMLAGTYSKAKAKVAYPCVSQMKIDGVRNMACLAPNGEVFMYSRGKKVLETGFDFIRSEIKRLLDGSKVYLDGEFYRHGRHLNDISGEVRNAARRRVATANSVQYHVFDCYDPSRPKLAYSERLRVLHELFYGKHLTWVIEVPYKVVQNEAELDAHYEELIEAGYEGQMVKKLAAAYTPGSRTNAVLKRKETFTDEFEIVNYHEGVGSNAGLIIWECKLPDPSRLTFTVVPNATADERARLYTAAKRNFSQFKGQMLTVQYLNVSATGVPLVPKGIEIRDYE